MNTTEFNGFTIEQTGDRFHVKAEGFKAEGYATLGGAKGAITKAAKAAETPNNEFVKSVIDLKTQPATSDDKEHASAELPAPPAEVIVPADVFKGEVTPFGVVPDAASEARIEGMTQALAAGDKIGWTGMRNDKDMPIHGDPKMAKMYAEMDYFGMTKNRDRRSRAVREGVNPNRKHKRK